MLPPAAFHPDYVAPLGRAHRFPMSKYGYLREALARRGLLGPGNLLTPSPASLEEIARAHEPSYAARAIDLQLDDAEIRRLGLPRIPLVARRARLAAAGTLLAARAALETGLALNAAGGSHHAGPDFASGFCLLNDVAVAAAALLAEGRARRVAVLDLDVHQGDGTALIFAGDARVLTVSVHAERNFPARKAVSDLDIPLPDATGDEGYLGAVGVALDRVLAGPPPDLVFYNAGVDIWSGDRLGRLGVSRDGIAARERLVLGRVRAAGLPLVCVMGGGYSDEPEELAARHAIVFEEAACAAAQASSSAASSSA